MFLPYFVSILSYPRDKREREETQSKEGKGEMADERKGLTERGKASGELRQK